MNECLMFSLISTHTGCTAPDLFGIELVELCLLTIASPQTQNLGFRAVSHVDELLVPPTLVNCTDVAAQDYTVITNL